MVVGISFDDKASKQITGLNKLMDDTGKGFSTIGKTGFTEMKKIEKGIDQVGSEAVSTGKEISKVGLAGEKAGIEVKKGMKDAEKGVDDVEKKSNKLTNSFNQLSQKGISSIQNLGNKFSGLGGIATSSMSRIGSSITNFVSAPIRGAIGLVKQYAGVLGLLSGGTLAASGMGRLSAIENARTSLTVMMGDAGRANKFMDDVLAFAKTTPFAFPDLAETSRNLIAFGMDEAKVVPTLKAIGDAAAATGKGSEGLNQVASAFGDMQISGKLGLDQINRLQSAGVPALKILSNQFGISTDQMKKKISKGMIDSVESIDMLVNGMQKGTKGVAGQTAAMAGIMEKTKENWTGSVDSMKSSITSGMAKIMEPAKPHIQNAMAWFGKKFGELPDVVFGVVDKVKPFAMGFSIVFMKAFRGITGVIETFKGGVGTLNGIVLFQKMGLTREQADRVVSLVKSVKEGIGDAFETIKGIGESVKTSVDGNLEGLINIALTFAEGFRDNWGPIKETVITLGIAVLAFKGIMMGLTVVSTINTLMTAYRTGTLLATLAQYGLNTAMLANPMTWVVAGIAALIGIGVALYRNWDTVTAKTQELWASIGGLEGAMRIIFGPIGILIGAAVDLAKNWDSTRSVWENVWGAIKRSAADSVNSVIGGINKMIDVINKIPGVNIPIVAKVDWGQAEAPKGSAGISNARPDGSHAAGLARVPRDGYIGELHRDEAVLTAQQSNALRSAGILGNSGEKPILNMDSGTSTTPTQSNSGGAPQFVFHISGENAKDIGRAVRQEIDNIFAGLNAAT